MIAPKNRSSVKPSLKIKIAATILAIGWLLFIIAVGSEPIRWMANKKKGIDTVWSTPTSKNLTNHQFHSAIAAHQDTKPKPQLLKRL